MTYSSTDDLPASFLRPMRITLFDVLLMVVLTAVLCAGALGIVLLTNLLDEVMAVARKPGDSPMAYLAIMATLFGLALLAAAISVLRFGKTAGWLLGFRRASVEWWLGAMVGMVVLSFLLAAIAAPLLERLTGLPAKMSTTDIVAQLLTSTWLALAATLVISVLAPVVEEVIFRGVIYGWLIGRFSRWTAIIGSAIPFGIAHGEPVHMLTAGILGLWLGFVRWRCGSIWPCIFAHIVNNTVFVWALRLFPTL